MEHASIEEEFFRRRVIAPMIDCIQSPDNYGTDPRIYLLLLADMKSVKLP